MRLLPIQLGTDFILHRDVSGGQIFNRKLRYVNVKILNRLRHVKDVAINIDIFIDR